MKSYLTGNPEIRLALNEDLSIGRGGGSAYGICLTWHQIAVMFYKFTTMFRKSIFSCVWWGVMELSEVLWSKHDGLI